MCSVQSKNCTNSSRYASGLFIILTYYLDAARAFLPRKTKRRSLARHQLLLYLEYHLSIFRGHPTPHHLRTSTDCLSCGETVIIHARLLLNIPPYLHNVYIVRTIKTFSSLLSLLLSVSMFCLETDQFEHPVASGIISNPFQERKQTPPFHLEGIFYGIKSSQSPFPLSIRSLEIKIQGINKSFKVSARSAG